MPKQKLKLVTKTFRATLTVMQSTLRYVIVRIPFDVHSTWGTRGQVKVRGDINGFEFRTSVFPTGRGYHWMLVNKKMQAGEGVRDGQSARFRLQPDLAARTITMPPELVKVFRQSKKLQKYFDSLNFSTRKELTRRISEAKSEATRRRRAERIAEWVMLMMMAESGDLPPVLELALARNAKARTGWEKMPPSHKRRHLMGITYYSNNPEAQAKRVAKAVGMMLQFAEGTRTKKELNIPDASFFDATSES